MIIPILRQVRSVPDLTRLALKVQREVTQLLTSLRSVSNSNTNDGVISIDHTGLKPTSVRLGQTSTPVSSVLPKFKSPSIKTVKSNAQALEKLYDQLEDIENIESTLVKSFGEVKGQAEALVKVRAIKKFIQTSVKTFNAEAVKKSYQSLPPQLKAVSDSLVKYLIDNLDPDTFDDLSEECYLSSTNEDHVFTTYIKIINLKNDVGYTFDEYFVVLTSTIDKQLNVRYHLTTLIDFRLPGKFPIGKNVQDLKAMKSVISIMLGHNDVISIMDKRHLPLDTKKASTLFKYPLVGKVVVEDDVLKFTLKKKSPSQEEVNSLLRSVLPILKSLIKSKQSKYLSRLDTSGSKAELNIILTRSSLDTSSSLKKEKLKQVKYALDLTDDDVSNIEKVLSGR